MCVPRAKAIANREKRLVKKIYSNWARFVANYPLRLIAPFKYGYKNIKYITSIKFLDTRKRNYWSNSGPYSVDGTIQPGIDHPLDFNTGV